MELIHSVLDKEKHYWFKFCYPPIMILTRSNWCMKFLVLLGNAPNFQEQFVSATIFNRHSAVVTPSRRTASSWPTLHMYVTHSLEKSEASAFSDFIYGWFWYITSNTSLKFSGVIAEFGRALRVASSPCEQLNSNSGTHISTVENERAKIIKQAFS